MAYISIRAYISLVFLVVEYYLYNFPNDVFSDRYYFSMSRILIARAVMYHKLKV